MSEKRKPPSSDQGVSQEQNISESCSASKEEDYGYYFYPERDGKKEESIFSKILHGRSGGDKIKCINNVNWCIRKNPQVKLLMSALQAHGCPISLQRHVSCEQCKPKVNGGFDPTKNQVVVCENTSKSRGICCSVLAHELIHMFDYCRADLDFQNIDHLACTEIRAASIMHCSFMSALQSGDASIFNVRMRHQECVKRKALMSVIMVRNVDIAEATKVIDRVFNKCYNDLEPFGRIPRSRSRDGERMLAEGVFYGYTDRRT